MSEKLLQADCHSIRVLSSSQFNYFCVFFIYQKCFIFGQCCNVDVLTWFFDQRIYNYTAVQFDIPERLHKWISVVFLWKALNSWSPLVPWRQWRFSENPFLILPWSCFVEQLSYPCPVPTQWQRPTGGRCWVRGWPSVCPRAACSVSPAEARRAAGPKCWPWQWAWSHSTEPGRTPCAKSRQTVWPGGRRSGAAQRASLSLLQKNHKAVW